MGVDGPGRRLGYRDAWWVLRRRSWGLVVVAAESVFSPRSAWLRSRVSVPSRFWGGAERIVSWEMLVIGGMCGRGD